MKFLLFCWFHPGSPKTVTEHIYAIKALSNYKIDIYNMYYLRKKWRSYVPKRIGSYNGLIFHNTCTYFIDYLRDLEKYFYPKLSEFEGVKILMKQDEMKQVYACHNFIKDFKINLLTTCLNPSEAIKVYPAEKLPHLKTLTTRTGYVTEEMKKFKPKLFDERNLDVVYRGMETPFEWGKLGYEKYYIGEEFLKRSVDKNVKIDISSKTSDRLNGKDWINLLNSSKASLAVESGASIFDWTGEVEAYCKKVKGENPNISFMEVWQSYLYKFEDQVDYAQISPRHIEAAYTKTLQVLFEGRYSDLIKPWEDFIPLKKDFSNLDEVLKILSSKNKYLELTENAYSRLINNKELTYEYFVENLNKAMREVI